MAKDVSALKAVSQNLMHANLGITDGVYGVLSELDVKEQIGVLGKARVAGERDSIEQLIALNRELIRQLKRAAAK
jgi:hypothetical protein